MSDIGRQATVGVIVVGQLIGTAIVMAILLQPSLTQFQGFAYLAMIAFGVTLIVSFIVLFRVFLAPPRPRRRTAEAAGGGRGPAARPAVSFPGRSRVDRSLDRIRDPRSRDVAERTDLPS